MQLINSVDGNCYVVTNTISHPLIRHEVFLAFAILAECLVSSRMWQGAVWKYRLRLRRPLRVTSVRGAQPHYALASPPLRQTRAASPGR